MAVRTAEEIKKLVESKRTTLEPLRHRMDQDYQRWRLEKFQEIDADGLPVEGFHVYTTNEPRVYAKKMISWLQGAERVINMLHRTGKRHAGDNDAHKERFIIGILQAADERLRNMGRLDLQDDSGWHTTIRGWLIGRAFLRKQEDGKTIIDVTPWDARSSTWEWGDNGLEWACHTTRKNRADIRALYGVEVPTDEGELEKAYDETLFDVHDFWDTEHNTVVVKDIEAKESTEHGSPRTPVYCAYVPTQPHVQTEIDGDHDPIADVGESVFDDVRAVYENYNLIMSIYLELTSRQRNGPYIVESKDGKRTLEANPYLEGTEIALKEGEKVEALKFIETTKDPQILAQLVSGELQRGSIPHSAYGELAFQLSGFAINQLREGIESVIAPRLKCMTSAYMQITQLLSDQYLTGMFEPVSVSGRDRNRAYFDEQIDPFVIAGACGHEIEFVGQLPQDDLGKMNMAQIARQVGPNGLPLLPDEFIREGVLKLNDADIVRDQVYVQMAQGMLPEAMLWTLLQAAENLGHPELARFYMERLMMLTWQKMQAMVAGGIPPNLGGDASGGQGSSPGLPQPPSRSLPFAFNGFSPLPPDATQLGGMVPPGAPRQGARNGGL